MKKIKIFQNDLLDFEKKIIVDHSIENKNDKRSEFFFVWRLQHRENIIFDVPQIIFKLYLEKKSYSFAHFLSRLKNMMKKNLNEKR